MNDATGATFMETSVYQEVDRFDAETGLIRGVVTGGMTFKFAGRFADAELAYGRARSILERLDDPDASDLAALYHNLGGLAHARGDHEAAEPLARRAVEIRSAAVGSRAPETLLDRSAHAATFDAVGRSAEAEVEIRDVLDDLIAALGEDHLEVAVARNNLAAIVQRRGDLADAERLYRSVLAAREAQLGPDSPVLAVPLSNLGTVLRARGRKAEARLLYERALRVLDGAVDDDHPTVRTILRNLGRVSQAHAGHVGKELARVREARQGSCR